MTPGLPFPDGAFAGFPPLTPQQTAAVLARCPPEHMHRLPDGNLALTELGVIHLCTALEDIAPDRARLARQLRYAFSRYCRDHPNH